MQLFCLLVPSEYYLNEAVYAGIVSDILITASSKFIRQPGRHWLQSQQLQTLFSLSQDWNLKNNGISTQVWMMKLYFLQFGVTGVDGNLNMGSVLY